MKEEREWEREGRGKRGEERKGRRNTREGESERERKVEKGQDGRGRKGRKRQRETETERQDRESHSPATSSVTIIGDWTVGGLCICNINILLQYTCNIM